MNFCGSSVVDHQVFQDEYPASPSNLDPPGCGACLEEETDDQEWPREKPDPPPETFLRNGMTGVWMRPPPSDPPQDLVPFDSRSAADPPSLFDDLKEVWTRPESSDLVSGQTTPKKSQRAALDSIEETLDNLGTPKSALSPSSAKNRSPPKPELWNLEDVRSPRRAKDTLDAAPTTPGISPPVSGLNPAFSHGSSMSLNPIQSPDWDGKPLFCPTLDNSVGANEVTPIDDLLKRVQEGFRVRFVKGPKSNSYQAMELVRLYLHPDRSRLCLQRLDDAEEEKKDDTGMLMAGETMALSEIIKLEVGRHYMSRLSFSVVVRSKSKGLAYYDFETKSPLEREVVLSTLMVLLDQAYNKTLPPRFNSCFTDSVCCESSTGMHSSGTLEQPIPCSPSLEQESIPRIEQQYGSLSWERPSSSRLFGSSKDSQSRNSAQSRLKEEQLEMSSRQRQLEPREERFGSSQSQSEDGHPRSSPNYNLENKLSAVSSYLSTVPEPLPLGSPGATRHELTVKDNLRLEVPDTDALSQIVLSDPWCTDDICTSALRDMADTCTGIFALKEDARGSLVPSAAAEQPGHIEEQIEEYITAALGAPAAIGSYALAASDVVWNAEETYLPKAPVKTKPESRRLQNRARLLNAQAARLRTLRNEMTFVSAVKKSKEKMQYIKTTQSFDDARLSSTKTRQLTAAADQLHSSPLLNHILDTLALDEPVVIPELADEGVEFYDSDPEDVKPRTIRKRGPRRVEADRLNKMNPPSPTSRARGLDKIPSTKKVRKLDEDVIIDIVQTMNNERLTLMWHPTQDEQNPNRPPVCVKVWIESGVYLFDGTFILPKLTWAKASEETQDANGDSRFRQQNKPFKSMDLLDICRIHPTDRIDRELHPFPSASRSFYIESATELFLMEAQTSEERDRIVYGLKLVVARLASLLMLRDSRAADEFFGLMSGNVPGEAPAWAQGERKEPPGEVSPPSVESFGG